MINGIHKTVYVESIKANIDVEIVNLVTFLNRLEGIKTLHSCQRDCWSYTGRKTGRSYVMFSCDNASNLWEIYNYFCRPEFRAPIIRWFPTQGDNILRFLFEIDSTDLPFWEEKCKGYLKNL